MTTAVTDSESRALPAPLRRKSGWVGSIARTGIWPVVFVLYATLVPREARLALGDMIFLPERIALLLVLPYTIKKIAEGAIRPIVVDWLVLASGAWMLVSMMTHYGLAWGFERGGALALDSTIGYFVARVAIRSFDDLRRVLILFAPGLLLAGGLMAIESLSHTKIVQPLFESIFGRLPHYAGGEEAGLAREVTEERLGLMRAKSVFPHPILGGVYLVSFLALYYFSGLRGWPRAAGIAAALLGFFSLSSAELLGLALSLLLIGYELARRYSRYATWQNFFLGLLSIAIAIQLVSQSGLLKVIIRYLTLNPRTGNYRLNIWEYGSQSVANHPLFGIGFQAYERLRWMVVQSVDAHWLLMAIRYGLFPALATFGAVVAVVVVLSRRSARLGPLDQRFVRGVAMALGIFATMAFTVNLLGGVLTWFTLLFGAAANFAFPQAVNLGARAPR